MNPIFIPTTTPVNQQTDSISVTLNPHDKSGMLPLTSSPNSKRGSIKSSLRALGFFSKSNSSNPAVLSTSMPNRSLSHNAASSHSNQLYSYEEVDPHHGFLKDRHKSSSPSRHISRVLEAGAARIGLFKKKQSFPDHYLSLPVGGVASSAANGMYMLHSEDLSVTEFAKLAGITILPEDDEDDTETTDDPSVNDSSLESHGMTKNETGSSSNTVNSDRHLTTGSVGSNKLIRKTNIWDPLFWSEPSSDDGGSRSVAASTSSTSLLISPVSVSAPASPSLVSEMFGPEMFNTKESEKLSNSGNVDKFGSADTDSRGNENSSLIRRNSCTPCELRSGAGSGFSVDRSGFPSQVPPKRLDQMPNPSKELIDLSGHRMSFSSLTAAAIELGNDQKSSQDIGGEQQQQLQTRNVESAHMTFQPSDPADMAAKSSQRLAFSVAFHALQPTRSKQNANRRASFQPGSSKSARTRSPSPSPLSKQLEISDSEGFDSPMEEKDEFDFNVTPAVGSETVDSTLQAPSTITQAPKKSRFEVTHLTVDQAPPREKRAANLHHHNRTQSLPHILSDLPIHPPSPSSSSSSISSSSPPPSPSQSQSATLRPPNSVPTRKFAPGTKVGRFTLVEETCAKHTDVLRAQQEEEQNQQVMSQRRASMGDMGSSIYSDDDCSSEHSMDGTLMKAQWRTSAASGVEGAVLDSTNPALKLEENVLVFQRKKTRRLQQPQPQPQPET
ncbi:hypothetical protein BGZ46_005621 [Entomortierella lignicola]|nr:hypothetical protein BGZ46_005621 [Entomortierella lignicola]